MCKNDFVYVRYGSEWHEAKVVSFRKNKVTARWTKGEFAGRSTRNIPLENIFPAKRIKRARTKKIMVKLKKEIKEMVEKEMKHIKHAVCDIKNSIDIERNLVEQLDFNIED